MGSGGPTMLGKAFDLAALDRIKFLEFVTQGQSYFYVRAYE